MKNKVRSYQGNKWLDGKQQPVLDALAIEHPLAIFINDQKFTLTMQTPGDEINLSLGLLFTEGIYKAAEIPKWSLVTNTESQIVDEVHLSIANEFIATSSINKRNLLSSTSCGICGSTEMPQPQGSLRCDAEFTTQQLIDAMGNMSEGQNAFFVSGGCHGAAAFDQALNRLGLMEDIGRHNAVDKLAGHLIQTNQMPKARLMTVSGRVSFEIVYKCFAMGIPHLVAVSAPSSLAVDYCKELGMRLYGFCRENRITQYA